MPVTIVDEEADVIGPFNRLSASQLNTWNSCPRMWYYEKRLRLKISQVPKLFMGRAVEDVVCRVLRESPGLVVASAPSDCLLYTSPSPRDGLLSRMPSSA